MQVSIGVGADLKIIKEQSLASKKKIKSRRKKFRRLLILRRVSADAVDTRAKKR
jgi:hypothetical protein